MPLFMLHSGLGTFCPCQPVLPMKVAVLSDQITLVCVAHNRVSTFELKIGIETVTFAF